MDTEYLRREVKALKGVLDEYGETAAAEMARIALSGSDKAFLAFVVSNELWGGAGSIADQAGINRSREARRSIEVAISALGLEQIRQGIVNVRTEMWIDAFSQWHSDGY
tara:strand:+ start:115 stop:441 length:327 start_codon:yes stop_codon:yes gene_type:complete